MTFEQALAALDGKEIPPANVRLTLYARRTGTGTLIYGVTAGYTLPEGVNDAEITIPAEGIRFLTDRTREFRGHSYLSIMQGGR
ncbi:MAG: hypothetical protein E6Q97_23820 [Desulfurellales bacterium]|nr:MAG: hypothetical protein E6Q97_23820 [Desulfurellales bacterium]